jgi:hypothetical protein
MGVTAALQDRRQAAFMDRVFLPDPMESVMTIDPCSVPWIGEYRWKYKVFVQCGALRADLREGFPQ